MDNAIITLQTVAYETDNCLESYDSTVHQVAEYVKNLFVCLSARFCPAFFLP